MENTMEIPGIINLYEYQLPEGLPVDPKKWGEAVKAYEEERQQILEDRLSGAISNDEANNRFKALAAKVRDAYEALLK